MRFPSAATTVTLVHLLCQLTLSYGLVTYFMDAQCGGFINMTSQEPAIKVVLTSRHSYQPNMACQISVSGAQGKQLLISFLELNISQSNNCTLDALELFDGKLSRGLRLLGSGKFCGTKAPDTEMVASQNDVIIRFTGGATGQGSGFKLLVSQVYKIDGDVCFSQDFRCDNGRCVDKALQGDGYDNCGDDSDESLFSANIVIALVLVTVIAALTVFLIVVIWSCCLNPQNVFSARPFPSPRSTRPRFSTSTLLPGVDSFTSELPIPCVCADCVQIRMETEGVTNGNGGLVSQRFQTMLPEVCLPPYSPTPLPGESVGMGRSLSPLCQTQIVLSRTPPPPYSLEVIDSLFVAAEKRPVRL